MDPIRSKVSEERRRGDRGRVRCTGRRTNERERAAAPDGGVVTDNEPAFARYHAELYLCVLLVRGRGARVEPEGGVVAAAADGRPPSTILGSAALLIRAMKLHATGHASGVLAGLDHALCAEVQSLSEAFAAHAAAMADAAAAVARSLIASGRTRDGQGATAACRQERAS